MTIFKLVSGSCYKELWLWGILIQHKQHMEKQQETELFKNCPEIQVKNTVLISEMVCMEM